MGIVYLQERKNNSRRTPSRRLIVRPHTPPKTTTTGKRSDFEALREKKCNRMERIKQAYRCKHRAHPPPSLPKFPMKPCSSQRMDRGEHSRHLPPIAHPSPLGPPDSKFRQRSPSENVENTLNHKVDGGEWCHDAMSGIDGDTSEKLDTWGGCGRTRYGYGTLGCGTELEPYKKRLNKHSTVTTRCNKLKSSKAK